MHNLYIIYVVTVVVQIIIKFGGKIEDKNAEKVGQSEQKVGKQEFSNKKWDCPT